MTEHNSIRESASVLRSLGDVMTWLRTFDPPGEFLDVVGLDEFTNDVVVRVKPQIYAVFDTT
jgi:hypothetical protein